MECFERTAYLGESFPLVLDTVWQSSPLFANDFGNLRISKTRMSRDDRALMMLAIENESCIG